MFFALSARLLSVVANDAVKGCFLHDERLLLAGSKATSCRTVQKWAVQRLKMLKKRTWARYWSGLLIYVSAGGFLLLKKRAFALPAYLNSSSRRV